MCDSQNGQVCVVMYVMGWGRGRDEAGREKRRGTI